MKEDHILSKHYYAGQKRLHCTEHDSPEQGQKIADGGARLRVIIYIHVIISEACSNCLGEASQESQISQSTQDIAFFTPCRRLKMPRSGLVRAKLVFFDNDTRLTRELALVLGKFTHEVVGVLVHDIVDCLARLAGSQFTLCEGELVVVVGTPGLDVHIIREQRPELVGIFRNRTAAPREVDLQELVETLRLIGIGDIRGQAAGRCSRHLLTRRERCSSCNPRSTG